MHSVTEVKASILSKFSLDCQASFTFDAQEESWQSVAHPRLYSLRTNNCSRSFSFSQACFSMFLSNSSWF